LPYIEVYVSIMGTRKQIERFRLKGLTSVNERLFFPYGFVKAVNYSVHLCVSLHVDCGISHARWSLVDSDRGCGLMLLMTHCLICISKQKHSTI